MMMIVIILIVVLICWFAWKRKEDILVKFLSFVDSDGRDLVELGYSVFYIRTKNLLPDLAPGDIAVFDTTGKCKYEVGDIVLLRIFGYSKYWRIMEIDKQLEVAILSDGIGNTFNSPIKYLEGKLVEKKTL